VRGLPPPRVRLQLALGIFCCGMLGVIGIELMPAPTAAVSIVSPPASMAVAPSPFRMAPLATFSDVLGRPLFSRTRRRTTSVALASSSFTLVAIVISAGERHALLGTGQPAKLSRVSEGQEIGGWTVEAILPEKVVVRRGDLREEVKVKEFGHAAAKAAVAGSFDPQNPPLPQGR
jgi:hypothetical protein